MESTQLQHLRSYIQIPSFSFNRFRRDQIGRSYSTTSMEHSEPLKPVEDVVPNLCPTPPQRKGLYPLPVSIPETRLSYSMPTEFNALPTWDSSMQPGQTLPQTFSVHQDVFPTSTIDNNGWVTKMCDNNLDIQQLDLEVNMAQPLAHDEAVPILDLRYAGPIIDHESISNDNQYNSRRMSGSSFTVSTTGGLSDMPSYEDFSTALSEAPSVSSDLPHPSNRNSFLSTTQLSPVASPRMTPQSRPELARTHSRGRASPSPRPTMRTAPYSLENRNKRWSTGSYASGPIRKLSPLVYHPTPEGLTPHQPRMSSGHSSPVMPDHSLPSNINTLQTRQDQATLPSNGGFRHSMFLPSQNFYENHLFETPPTLLSQGISRMLQSNAGPLSLHSHYADFSDPPELYASLHEEQIPPPAEDMSPDDPSLVPHEQELRFNNDLYTPRWVRGHGNKREGWCGICKPGRWLVLKNSAFWYDKSFTHGISAATGSPFQEPQETRRMDGNPDVWEGLCGSCNEWVALVSSKKKGTTWFRHAYKCHTHPKVKDAPKRRRESSHIRALVAPAAVGLRIASSSPPKMTLSQPVSSAQAQNIPSVKTGSPPVGLPTMI